MKLVLKTKCQFYVGSNINHDEKLRAFYVSIAMHYFTGREMS